MCEFSSDNSFKNKSLARKNEAASPWSNTREGAAARDEMARRNRQSATFGEKPMYRDPDTVMAAQNAPPKLPPIPDATDEAVREADKQRQKGLSTARRNLTNSFVTGRGSVLGGKR